jgi:hypothetical protein
VHCVAVLQAWARQGYSVARLMEHSECDLPPMGELATGLDIGHYWTASATGGLLDDPPTSTVERSVGHACATSRPMSLWCLRQVCHKVHSFTTALMVNRGGAGSRAKRDVKRARKQAECAASSGRAHYNARRHCCCHTGGPAALHLCLGDLGLLRYHLRGGLAAVRGCQIAVDVDQSMNYDVDLHTVRISLRA